MVAAAVAAVAVAAEVEMTVASSCLPESAQQQKTPGCRAELQVFSIGGVAAEQEGAMAVFRMEEWARDKISA